MSTIHLSGLQKKTGVETLPDRQGNAKTCISGQSYVCGRACLGIGSKLISACNRKLNPLNIAKARNILSVLRDSKKFPGLNQKPQDNRYPQVNKARVSIRSTGLNKSD